jgi:rhodanese-related sulfurtransferase
MFGMGNHESETDLDSRSFEKGFKETEGAQLIDVRTPGEFNEGHIPGASNIDVYSPDFSDKIQALDKDAPVYLYCRSGSRSGSVVAAMKQLGYERVYHLAHGIIDWHGETETN